jgi:hypothetical protein
MRLNTLVYGAAFALAVSTRAASASTLLIAAGGGGGAGYCCGTPGDAGQVDTAGDAGGGPGGGAGGVGGTGGGGGFGDGGIYNGGGAGFSGAGGDGAGTYPAPGVEGAAGLGGQTAPTFAGGLGGNENAQTANGGYGGGGDGVTAGGGGGGGSYIDPSLTFLNATAGLNGNANGSGGTATDGLVVINGTNFSYTGALQTYVVPTTGLYDIADFGAQGGSGDTAGDIGGYGAYIEGLDFLTAGTTLDIVVGGGGLTGDFDGAWGGGGLGALARRKRGAALAAA